MKPKFGDYILIIVVLLSAVFIFGSYFKPADSNEKLIASISQNGNLIQKIDLSAVNETTIIDINGDYTEKIIAEKGRIRFIEANCPDKVCINTGWLTKSGQSAVCLPNRVIIKLEGQKSDIDIIVG